MGIEKKVTIRLEAKGIEKLKKAMSSLNTQLNKVGLEINQLGTIMDKSTRKTLTETQALKRLGKTFNEMNMQRVRMGLNRFNRELDKTKMKTNNAKQSLGRFKMELLGIMFFGMAMVGMFTGMLQPALDAFGVFDLFGMMLLLLFLPTAEKVNEKMLTMFDRVSNLNDPTKEMIGNLTLLGLAIGFVLFVGGQLFLGLDSLGKLYKVLISWEVLTIAVNKLLAMSFFAVIGWILIIIAVIALLYVMWKYNIGGMRDHAKNIFDGIKTIFLGFVNVVKGVFQIIFGIFEAFVTGDLTMLKEGVSNVINGIVDIFYKGFGKIIISGLSFVWDLCKVVWGGIIDLLDGIISRITGKQSDIKAAFWGLLPDWLQDILKGVSSWAKGITDAIKGAVGIDVGGSVDAKISGMDRTRPLVYAPEINVSGDFTDRSQAFSLTRDFNKIMEDEFKKAGQGD